MLPFTPVSFIPRSQTVDRPVTVHHEEGPRDHDSNPSSSSSSSAKFYQSVTEGAPSRLKAPLPPQKPTPSAASIKSLYNRICGDDYAGVKQWIDRHMDTEDLSQVAHVVSQILRDPIGSDIAIACISHKSYHSFKYLLTTVPTLLTSSSYYGKSLHEFAKMSGDETIFSLLATFPPKAEAKFTPPPVHPPTLQYCALCEVTHSDPAHETSISHVFAEQRTVPELNPHLDPGNIGYKMMSKAGWSESQGLGPSGEGRKHLIKTHLKTDRRGLGSKEKKKARVTHFSTFDESGVRENKIHKREVKIKTETKRSKKKDAEKKKQWEIDFRREMNQLD